MEKSSLLNRCIAYGISIVLLIFFQSSPDSFLTIGGISPNIVIPAVIAVAIWEGERTGAVFGLFAGLVWEIIAWRTVGFRALFLMATGCTVGLLFRVYLRPVALSALLVNIVAVFAEGFIYLVFHYCLFNSAPFFKTLAEITLPYTLYSTAFALPLFYLFKAVSAGLRKYE